MFCIEGRKKERKVYDDHLTLEEEKSFEKSIFSLTDSSETNKRVGDKKKLENKNCTLYIVHTPFLSLSLSEREINTRLYVNISVLIRYTMVMNTGCGVWRWWIVDKEVDCQSMYQSTFNIQRSTFNLQFSMCYMYA